MDIQYLMKQAKKLEKAMADAREKLAEILGRRRVGRRARQGPAQRKVRGHPPQDRPEGPGATGSPGPRAEGQPQQGMDVADLSMLEDLVSAAINAGVEKARTAADAHMAQATGGVKIPGIG